MNFDYFKAVKNKQIPRHNINWTLLDEQIEQYHLFRTGEKINLITTTYPHSKVRDFIENLIPVMMENMRWNLKTTLKALEWDPMNWNNFLHFRSFKVVPIMSFIKRIRFIRDYKYYSVTNARICYWIDMACMDEELTNAIMEFFK